MEAEGEGFFSDLAAVVCFSNILKMAVCGTHSSVRLLWGDGGPPQCLSTSLLFHPGS